MIKDLGDIGFAATGTIRQNRLKGCPIVPVDTMKKKDKGAFERLSAGNTEMVRWNDNNVVTFCSNAVGAEPVGTARRWIKGKHASVRKPAVVKMYNECMGGVDLMDRALSNMRPKIKGKKWYWVLLLNALNILMVFSWRMFQISTDEKKEQKEFVLAVIDSLLKSRKLSLVRSRAGPSHSTNDDVTFDGIGHYPGDIPVRRCKYCKKKLQDSMR